MAKKWPVAHDKGRFWQISAWSPADYVSNFRTLIAPILGLLCLIDGASWNWWWLVWLIVGISDKVDGWLATKLGSSLRGPTNDEQSDKVCISTAFLVCIILGLAPWYLLALMVARDVGVTVIRMMMRRRGLSDISSAQWLGKIKTVGQFALIVVALAPTFMHQPLVVTGIAAATAVVSIMSGIQLLALALNANDESWLIGTMGRLGLPNWISAFRLSAALIVPYIFIAEPIGENSFIIAVIVGAFVCLTDVVDGTIARVFNLRSDFGKVLDPIADKAAQYLLALGLLVSAWHMLPPLSIGLIAGLCLIGRDIAFLTWFVFSRERIDAGWCDKVRSVAVVAWLGSIVVVWWVGDSFSVVSYGLLLFAAFISVMSAIVGYFRVRHRN